LGVSPGKQEEKRRAPKVHWKVGLLSTEDQTLRREFDTTDQRVLKYGHMEGLGESPIPPGSGEAERLNLHPEKKRNPKPGSLWAGALSSTK